MNLGSHNYLSRDNPMSGLPTFVQEKGILSSIRFDSRKPLSTSVVILLILEMAIVMTMLTRSVVAFPNCLEKHESTRVSCRKSGESAEFSHYWQCCFLRSSGRSMNIPSDPVNSLNTNLENCATKYTCTVSENRIRSPVQRPRGSEVIGHKPVATSR